MAGTDVAGRRESAAQRPAASRTPSLLLGIGLGGFIDGIVLHQLLRWHHMLTGTRDYPATTVEGLNVNTVADGLFHVGTWALLFIGSLWSFSAWRAGRRPPTPGSHAGLLLAGWGLFNVVEGVVNHHILRIHHVRDDVGGPAIWDISFLVFGLLLIVVGLALAREGHEDVPKR